MQFYIVGNIEVTESIEEYIYQKMDFMNKYFDERLEGNIHVNLKVYDNNRKQKVNVSVKTVNGLNFNADSIQTDLYSAIDLVSDKIERQIRKHKTKVNRKFKRK